MRDGVVAGSADRKRPAIAADGRGGGKFPQRSGQKYCPHTCQYRLQSAAPVLAMIGLLLADSPHD